MTRQLIDVLVQLRRVGSEAVSELHRLGRPHEELRDVLAALESATGCAPCKRTGLSFNGRGDGIEPCGTCGGTGMVITPGESVG